MARHTATNKVEIANRIFAVPPTPRHRSIFTKVAGTVARWKSGEFGKVLELNATPQMLAYVGLTVEEAQVLVDAWNDGERWIEQ